MTLRPRRAMTWKFERWHVIHVLPVGDVRDHVATSGCWCGPRAVPTNNGDVHHHRADDRRPGYGSGDDEAGAWRVVAWTEPEAGRYRGRKGGAT